MLNQIRTKAIHRMRFLIVAPLMLLLLSIVSCENSLNSDLVKPSISPTGAFLFKDLIGTWTNIDRTTINSNDGKTPRDFPERAGDIRACTSKLVLGADGHFQMLDEQSGQSWSGNWQSDKTGVSIQLQYFEPSLSNAANSKFLISDWDESVANNHLPKVISLDVTSLKAGKMEAWQSYAATGDLSGGQVYYVYQKQ